jgi:hypothetical protein
MREICDIGGEIVKSSRKFTNRVDVEKKKKKKKKNQLNFDKGFPQQSKGKKNKIENLYSITELYFFPLFLFSFFSFFSRN